MKNYRTQNGCTNCKHVFNKLEYDDPPEWYCTLGAPDRPLCMSVYMGETPLTRSGGSKSFEKHFEAWEDWKENRQVDSFGICDEYIEE